MDLLLKKGKNMEQSERYWCDTCERIHIDECDFFLLDNQRIPDMLDPVRRTQDNRYSSAEGSSVAHGSGFVSQPTLSQVTEDLPALPFPTSSPTPRGTTSVNVAQTAERYCPLCCIASSTPCGSGKHLDKNSENTDKPNRSPILSPGESSTAPQGLSYGLMWRYCCGEDCGKFMGVEFCKPQHDGEISHDMCPPCFGKAMARKLSVVLLMPTSLLAWMWKAVELV